MSAIVLQELRSHSPSLRMLITSMMMMTLLPSRTQQQMFHSLLADVYRRENQINRLREHEHGLQPPIAIWSPDLLLGSTRLCEPCRRYPPNTNSERIEHHPISQTRAGKRADLLTANPEPSPENKLEDPNSHCWPWKPIILFRLWDGYRCEMGFVLKG